MMRLSNFAKIAASVKSAVTSRDAASTQQNLEIINASVLKLTATLNAYTGGLLAASSISGDEAKLGQDLKNAIADAKASETSTPEETRAIIEYIQETLEPNIKACMAAMKDKKELLVKAGLHGTVLGDLNDLRDQTNALGNEMVAKAPATHKEEGAKVNGFIDKDFEEGIAAFA